MQLDYLSTAKNDGDLKAMIANLPNGLEHTYETILNHISSQYPDRIEEVKRLLQCLVVASPTLTAADLAEILAMEPGQAYLDFDLVATDPYDVLEVIAPLVILTSSQKPHSVVRLAHYSLEEYLSSTRMLQSQARQFYVKPEEANAWLASICLQYLTFDVFNLSKHHMAKSGSPSLEEYNFRRYAALNWVRHYKEAANVAGFKEQCKPYVDRLFRNEDGSPCFKKWQEIYQQKSPYDELHQYSPICFAISHGLDDIVDDLIPHLTDIDMTYSDGYTCLTIAAKWNRANIVRKLLDLGADIEKPASRQCTALHLAAEFASREACDMLLDAGASPNARSSSDSTPFYRACRGGNVHIVERLKECGSDINVRTDDSWTPIMEAAENGHEAVVDLLLEWGADLTTRTDQGWTVFLVAEDGFHLAPSMNVMEKLKRAAPKEVYEQFLKDRMESAEDISDESDCTEELDGKREDSTVRLSKPLGHAPPRKHPTPF
jgi:ankyrin repeat protein